MSGILFVQSKMEPACFKSLKQAISQSQGFELSDTANFAEASTVVLAGFVGVAVLSIAGKDDLIGVIQFLNAQAVAIKGQKSLRVLVFNNLPNPKILSTLKNLGCSEALDFQSSAKAVLLKIQRNIKLARSSQAMVAGSAKAKGRTDDSVDDDEGPKTRLDMVEALTHTADYWIMRNKPDAKRIMGRWLVEMIGPGPAAGEWIQIPQKEATKGVYAFEWKPRDPQGVYATPTGRWVYLGRNVEFDWRVNRWRLVGNRVSLTFQEGDQVVAKRFFTENDDVIKIAANSALAKSKLPAIEATFNGSGRADAKLKADKSGDAGNLVLNDDGDEEAEGESLDFSTGKKKKRSKDLSIELDPENEGKELGIEVDGAAKEGKELSIELGPEEQGKELSIKLDPENQGKELSLDLGKDEESKGWNDKSDTPDPDAPAFNDHGARRENIFNSGRGLTQGQGSDKVTYDPDDYSTGVDAFKPVRVNGSLGGFPAEVLESAGLRLVLRVEGGQFSPSSVAEFTATTENLDQSDPVRAQCKILNVTSEDASKAHLIEVELDPASEKAWLEIQLAVATRQESILQFFKMAKGA